MLLVCLLVCRCSVRLSLIHRSSACLSLLCSSVAGPLLVYHWSITGLSLVCLLGSWPLLCSSVTGPLLVYHWSITGLSPVCSSRGCCPVTGLSLVCHWSVTGLSLVCHYPVTGLSLSCHWSVTILSLVCLLGSWPLVRVADRAPLVRHSSACSSFCWSVGRPSLICLLES